MGENYGKKTKVSMNTSEEINFQTYVDLVKQKTITWHVFENLLKGLAYSSIPRLKLLNAILLIELTTDYSDIDRLKYLNNLLSIQSVKLRLGTLICLCPNKILNLSLNFQIYSKVFSFASLIQHKVEN